MNEIIIRTNQLSKKFKEEAVISALDFSVAQGEICALIGKNGAGKSTLFKLLSGRFFPSAGTLQLFGQSGKQLEQARKRMSFMIESPQFFAHFTAQQNLEYFRIQRGIPAKHRVEEVLKIVDLADQKKKKFKNYSLGMKQRLGLALALLSNPDCLVLDEPVNGLDAQGINKIRTLLKKLNQENHITILISSHILAELQLLATRFVFMDQGAIVGNLTQTEFKQKVRKQINLRIDDPSKAAQLLERGLPDIEYRVFPDGWISIQNHLEDSGSINQLLTQNGLVIYEMRIEGSNLEEYFLDLVEVNEA